MMDIVYIAIAIIAVVIGVVVYSRNFKDSERVRDTGTGASTKPDSGTTTGTDLATDKTTDKTTAVTKPVIDRMPVDQKYAQAHGMWVCKYCETINKCPPGMTARKISVEGPKPASGEEKSRLRGDLLNKTAADCTKSAGTSDEPVCIACGKPM